ADAGPLELYLSSGGRANSMHGDGRLQSQPPAADEPADTWTHDPDLPVPFITNESSAQVGGPDDYRGVETRGDVLVYTTEPLEEDVEIIGPVRLVAYVSTDARDTDITAKLVDVHPGGFAQRLCDGMVRLRYRDGFDQQRPVTPGEVYEVEVVMWDTCIRLSAGHRIRLEVASSAFPKYDVNLGTGGDLVTETAGVVAQNTIWHTNTRPSRLILTTSR
ncbi:MAG TPA: CocE/NonD family hydrolase, partial [Mycobacteriales bacterium]|nr:CocE/NonD family hydrolase [Mycobacteriales bacterium]